MTARRSRLARCALVLLGLLHASACAQLNTFTNESFLSASLRGKSWSPPLGVEPDPEADPSDPRTFSRFDAGSDGDSLYIAGSFWSNSAGRFGAHILKRDPDSGWLHAGSGTLAHAISSKDIGLVRLIEGASGGLLALLGQAGSATRLDSAQLQGGLWEAVRSKTGLSSVPTGDLAASALAFRADVLEGSFDELGRTHLAWNGAKLQLQVRDSGEPTGLNATEEDSSLAAKSASTAPLPDFRILSSGVTWSCAFYRNHAAGAYPLESSCFPGLKADLEPAVELWEDIDEWDAASDADGTLLVVARLAGTSTLQSLQITATQDDITAANPLELVIDPEDEGFEVLTADPLGTDGDLLPGIRVVAVGQEEFLAVWTETRSVASDSEMRLRAARYSAAAARWGKTVTIGSATSFSERVRISGLELKGRPGGDAVLSWSFASTPGASAAEDVRVTQVARYQVTEGWMKPVTLGEGCGRLEVTGASPVRNCSLKPRVALTDSGDAVVVFPDQDANGLFRLMASVFTRSD